MVVYRLVVLVQKQNMLAQINGFDACAVMMAQVLARGMSTVVYDNYMCVHYFLIRVTSFVVHCVEVLRNVLEELIQTSDGNMKRTTLNIGLLFVINCGKINRSYRS